jgi:hypothetical protein
MKLFHFTGLHALVGADGVAALRAHVSEYGKSVNLHQFAASGSILTHGVQPHKDASYDDGLRSPLSPCVWLTDDPNLPLAYRREEWRISVIIPSRDRRLTPWLKYFRKHPREEAREFASFVILSEEMQGASESFYVYFGPIPLVRLSAIEKVVAP